MTKHRSPKTDGYIVIIVLLLTAVLLMLGLSLATRTTEEVSQSGQEADTTRVFNAAETGIEAALYTIQTNPGTFIGPYTLGTSPTTITNPIFGDAAGAGVIQADTKSKLVVTGQTSSDFTVQRLQGEVLTLKWQPTGTTVSWKHDVDCSDAAAVIVTLYNSADSKAYHLAYNPMKNASEQCADKGSNFSNSTYVTSPSTGSKIVLNTAAFPSVSIGADSLLRIRPLYWDATFTVTGSSAITLISTASDSTGGTSKETRKIQVIRTEPAAPSVFDYAVFSGGSLTK